MKKALSLIEVMVAIVLLTLIIAITLQIQQNNIFYLDKFKDTKLYNSYIGLIATSNADEKRNKKVYLSDMISFDDDDIRKEFKEIRIEIKDKDLKDMPLPKNDYIQTANIVESTYSIDDKAKKVFYSFKLNY